LLAEEDRLRKSPCVIVAGDNDEAGESLPRTVANILKGHDVRSVTWPKGCKDANDVLCLLGEGALSDCLNRAQRIDPPGGIITGFSDLPPLSARRVLRGGTDLLDARAAMELGAMSVITGTPGAGKSTFTTFLAHHITVTEGVRCGLLSFETHPHRTRDHLARLCTGRGWADLSPDRQSRARA
jgi:twinkle protein